MQRLGDHLRLSATDLTTYLSCAHATTLDLQALEGHREAPAGAGVDEQLQLVRAQGERHERSFLQQLKDQGRQVVEVPGQGSARERADATLQAVREGAEVVYQAAFLDEQWVGYADFLLRVDRPSALGDWSYDIGDTKLARHLQVTALLQMASYARHLEHVQGVPPQQLVVVTGDGAQHPWRLVDVASYARRTRARLEQAVATRPATVPVPVAHCGRCRWQPVCAQRWQDEDDLVLVAGLRGDHRQRLHEAGVTTVVELAQASAATLTATGIGRGPRDRLRSQAALQVRERETGLPSYELLPAREGEGLGLLPEPDEGDVYLDFEGDPFAADGAGREYLAGVWTRQGEFLDWWAHDRDEERQLTRALLTWLDARWRQFPGMHIYHYAAYEQTALKRMAQQYATAETELDMLLRGGRFVDLYAVVRQGLQISKPSYSIKQLEAFYWEQTRTAEGDEVADGMASVVEYERWLAGGRTDDSILERLRAYNREDVRSTHALHEWLEERRTELVGTEGAGLSRPELTERAATVDTEDMGQETELAARLVAAGHELLAGVVGFHRRETKQGHWEFFRTKQMSEQDLIEDRAATLGGLGAPVHAGTEQLSNLWLYRFPPQETTIGSGQQVHDAREHTFAGTVFRIDPEGGSVVLKLGTGKEAPTPQGLVVDPVVHTVALQASLHRLAEGVLAGPDSRGPDSLGLALLEGRVPPGMAPAPGESPGEVVRRVGAALDRQVLAVQGPPGSGKSYSGKQLIRDLLDAGLRVGVTANSHAVIGHLMDGVGRPAVRKVTGTVPREQLGPVRLVSGNPQVDRALAEGATLVGGTAWLWAREEMAGSVDVLVVDEAGQFALANALAVGQAATRGIVLLGDPQQLPQVVQGTHPYGAGVSVLDHLVRGAETIAVEHGVFLDRTYRMHPDLTRFVSELSYASRLESVAGLEHQQIEAPGALSGSGLRWVPVAHRANVAESAEEAEVVAGLVADLLKGEWTAADGARAGVTLSDILVVAPYNAQVNLLTEHLPEGARVGTVDAFQGQQAPVVIYSMASSSAEDAPRGVPFLFDTHRLNVAVSRARALAVVVGNPQLLEAPVRDPHQLRLVNALCRLVDLAQEQTPAAGPGVGETS